MIAEGEDVDLEQLRQFVLDELESYRYEVPEGALGRPFADEKVERMLAEMRAFLVKPEWRVVEVRDTCDGVPLETPEFRRCVLVADDPDTHEMYYDPLEKWFVLTMDDPPKTFGVWGDAVGCFMAR